MVRHLKNKLTIEDHGEKRTQAFGEHGKQLVKYNDEKVYLPYSKQRYIFEELANRRMEEIQDLSKQIDFNNLIYHYKGKIPSNICLASKGPLKRCRSIEEGKIILEKAEEERKQFKNKIETIGRGKNKTGC